MLAITIPSPRVPYEDHTEGAAMSVTPHAVPAPPEVAASSAAFAVTGVAFGGGSRRRGARSGLAFRISHAFVWVVVSARAAAVVSRLKLASRSHASTASSKHAGASARRFKMSHHMIRPPRDEPRMR